MGGWGGPLGRTPPEMIWPFLSAPSAIWKHHQHEVATKTVGSGEGSLLNGGPAGVRDYLPICSLPWPATSGAGGSHLGPTLYRHRVSRREAQMEQQDLVSPCEERCNVGQERRLSRDNLAALERRLGIDLGRREALRPVGRSNRAADLGLVRGGVF